MKVLIAYYSYEGNTKLLAETMSKEIDADLLQIIPEKEMKSKGFMKFVWGGKQAVMGDKPPIKKLEIDPMDYDLTIIGTPVWAGRPAPPIKTFMVDHLPPGKDLAFFYSFEGGEGNTFKIMEKMANGGQILGKKGFMAPLKKDRDSSLENAKTWVSSLLKNIRSDIKVQ